jgi:hypothetical protein
MISRKKKQQQINQPAEVNVTLCDEGRFWTASGGERGTGLELDAGEGERGEETRAPATEEVVDTSSDTGKFAEMREMIRSNQETCTGEKSFQFLH